MDSVAIMKPVTKFSVAINAPEAAGEAVVNAFRAAMTPRAGASFIAFPRDVQGAATEAKVRRHRRCRRWGQPLLSTRVGAARIGF